MSGKRYRSAIESDKKALFLRSLDPEDGNIAVDSIEQPGLSFVVNLQEPKDKNRVLLRTTRGAVIINRAALLEAVEIIDLYPGARA